MKHFIVLGNVLKKVRVQAIVDGAAKFDLKPLFFRINDNDSLEKMITEHDVMFAVSVGMRAADAYAKGFLEAHGINTLVLDLGYLSRAKGPNDETGYNQVGINRLCWIAPMDVPDDRLKKHNIRFESLPPLQPAIALVLGQVPGDTQHGLSPGDLKAWLMHEIGRIKAQGYRLEYRPHPKASKFMAHYKDKLFDKVYLSQAHTLEENLRRASLVLTYNSTAGLTALVMGRKVVSSPIAHFHGLETPEQIYKHLCKVAYSQWTCEELRDGTALTFMSRFDARFIGIRYDSHSTKVAS